MNPLTQDQIVDSARGVCSVRQADDATLEMVRFPDAALAFYDAQSQAASVRAHCPAGVRLDFVTDSDRVALELRIGPAARPWCHVDVYADGVFWDCLGADDPPGVLAGELRCGPPRAAGRRRVTVYLPQVRACRVASVALADGASFAPAPTSPVMLALGDSITQGMSATYPSLIYPTVAARILGMDCHNCAVGGAVFDAGSLTSPPVQSPALITVAYGTNDWGSGRPVAEAERYLRRLREFYADAPVAVLLPIWREGVDGVNPSETRAGRTLPEFRAALAETASALDGVRVIESERLLPPAAGMLPDNVHPDTAGHVVYGTNLARVLLQ